MELALSRGDDTTNSSRPSTRAKVVKSVTGLGVRAIRFFTGLARFVTIANDGVEQGRSMPYGAPDACS